MKIYLILIYLLTAYHTYGQSLTVIYDAYATNTSQDMIDFMPSLKDYKVVYKFSLTIAKGKSKFSRDSLMILKNPNNQNEIWSSQFIFKDYKKDLWIETGSKYLVDHGYQKKLSEMYVTQRAKWLITDESKIILGMKSIKAIKGEYIAWFTKEIPISDGPQYGDFGLPGLVLIYDDGRNVWEAVDITYNKNNVVMIPNLKLETKSHLIKLELNEYKHLPSNQIISITKKSPLNQWIKFE